MPVKYNYEVYHQDILDAMGSHEEYCIITCPNNGIIWDQKVDEDDSFCFLPIEPRSVFHDTYNRTRVLVPDTTVNTYEEVIEFCSRFSKGWKNGDSDLLIIRDPLMGPYAHYDAMKSILTISAVPGCLLMDNKVEETRQLMFARMLGDNVELIIFAEYSKREDGKYWKYNDVLPDWAKNIKHKYDLLSSPLNNYDSNLLSSDRDYHGKNLSWSYEGDVYFCKLSHGWIPMESNLFKTYGLQSLPEIIKDEYNLLLHHLES